MRFKKGSKVEVMDKKDMLAAWRGAEIISGNGHTYSVRYDSYPPMASKVAVERVSRKIIRPCPPSVEGVTSWVAGEAVEVFDGESWKIATILQVSSGDYYTVRLLGSSHELRVHKFSIRVRQSWQNDKWIVMGKGLGNCGDLKYNKLSTSNSYPRMNFQAAQANVTVKMQGGNESFAAQKNTGVQGDHIASSRTLKRAAPYGSSLLEAHSRGHKKIRAIEEDDRRQRKVPALEKGQSWRQALLASKGLMVMLGFAAFSWHKQWGHLLP